MKLQANREKKNAEWKKKCAKVLTKREKNTWGAFDTYTHTHAHMPGHRKYIFICMCASEYYLLLECSLRLRLNHEKISRAASKKTKIYGEELRLLFSLHVSLSSIVYI